MVRKHACFKQAGPDWRRGKAWAAFLALFPIAMAGAQGTAKPTLLSDPTALPVPAFADDSVRFRVEAVDSAGETLTYAWNFGDGGESTVAAAVPEAWHRFTAPGHYPVTVRIRNSIGAVTGSMVVSVHSRPTAGKPASASSIILDAFRGRVWCVNPDQGSVSAVDAYKHTLLFEAPAGVSPQTLAQAPDGSIWVANHESATLSALSPDNGNLQATLGLPYGAGPQGIAFNPQTGAGYVTLEGSGKLLRFDPATRKVTGEVDLGPTPRGLAVTGDGKRIFVSRFISPADHSEVWEVDAATFARTRTIILALDESPDSETSGGGVLNYLAAVVISPDGKEALVPCEKDNTGRGPVRNGLPLTHENSLRTAMAHIDLRNDTEDPLRRDDFDNASLASAAVYSPLGDFFFTALQGSNAVHAMDPYNHGAVLERNKQVGAAPRGLVLDPKSQQLFVHNFLDRSVSIFDLASVLANTEYVSKRLATVVTVSHEALSDAELRGKRIFYNASDTRMSLDGYISCAGCHLGGATDGRVWDFTDRGEGLRRTTNLLGRSGTGHGPIHWSANFDEVQDFENDMRGPFGGTGFMSDEDFHAGTRSQTLGDPKAGVSPDLDDLAAYVKSLMRVHASPFRKSDGTMTAEAMAGEKIFNSAEAGCARCHIPPLYTDSRLPGSVLAKLSASGLPAGDFVTAQGYLVHDIGTLKPTSGHRLGDTLMGIDTPTLKGVWETGPYLHDGSAATIADVIGSRNAGDKHGKTSQLSAVEKAQLAAFLMQLDDGPAPGTSIRDGSQRKARETLRLQVTQAGGAVRILLSGGAGDARLSLYAMGGRRIGMEAGRGAETGAGRQWIWNGHGPLGKTLPPGLYQLVAETEGGKAVAQLPWVP